MIFLPLSHEFIRNAHVGDLYDFVCENGLTIDIAGKTFTSKTILGKMTKSEMTDFLMNTPRVRDDSSNFDRFCTVQENSGAITNHVSKSELQKHVNGFKDINDYTLDELYNVPLSAKNLRKLLAAQGLVKISDKNPSTKKYCDMLELTPPKWGYQDDIKLWVKHCGLTRAENLPADRSFEYLGIQSYPKTIMEYLLMSPERYNRDVQQIRSNLKLVIRDMEPRTRLVKRSIIELFRDEYRITEKLGRCPSLEKLDEIIEKYGL